MLLAPGGALAADIVSYAIVQDDAKLKVQRKRLRLFGVYPVELSPFCDDIFCPARCQARGGGARLQDPGRRDLHSEDPIPGTARSARFCYVDGRSMLDPPVELGAYLIREGWVVALPGAPFLYHTLEKGRPHQRPRDLGLPGRPDHQAALAARRAARDSPAMQLSDAHLEIRAQARRFADEAIRPVAAELDRTERFPEEVYARMAGLGLFGITVAETDGGAGADALAYALVMEELARGYASIADQCGLVELVGTLLGEHGTPDQKARYLAPLLRAERRCAYAITEAEAGSDVAAIRTTATRTAGGWRLDGAKQWIHNAPVCDFAVVLARTDPAAGRRGMSVFLVQRELPGVEAGAKERKMGQCASPVGALRFEGVELPEDARLGPENRGFHMMMSVLDRGRVGIAALAVGILQAALDAAVDYARTRRQFGQAIAEFQGVQWLLADMAKDTVAARLLTHAAALQLDRGERATLEAAMAKCFAGDAAVQHTSNAVQLFGGSGYIRGFEVERLYRDAKITQIYEGTNQIQRNLIARHVLNQ